MRVIPQLVLVAMLLFFAACKTKKTTTETMEETTTEHMKENEMAQEEVLQYGMFVASKRVDCQGMVPQKCLLVRASWENVWSNFFDEIEGFDYQEGYEYHLEVKRITLKNVPADASAYKYVLVRQIDKVKKDSDIRREFEKPTFEGQWNLDKLGDKNVRDFKATLLFKDNEIVADSGCNSLFGLTFTTTDTSLMVSEGMGASTMKACLNENIEDAYFAAIKKIKSYKATATTLTVFDEKGDTLMQFSR